MKLLLKILSGVNAGAEALVSTFSAGRKTATSSSAMPPPPHATPS